MTDQERIARLEREVAEIRKIAEELAPHCSSPEDRRLDVRAREMVRQYEAGSKAIKAILGFITILGGAALAIRELRVWEWFGR